MKPGFSGLDRRLEEPGFSWRNRINVIEFLMGFVHVSMCRTKTSDRDSRAEGWKERPHVEIHPRTQNNFIQSKTETDPEVWMSLFPQLNSYIQTL